MLKKLSGWDHPFFKVLANNDTGQASGHQSGFVVPKPIQQYLPIILGQTSKQSPAIRMPLIADLFLGNRYVATVPTRYQQQTWGGKKRENRITANLKPLLDFAREGDVLILHRKIECSDRYRLHLLLADTGYFGSAKRLIGERSCGELFEGNMPESFLDGLREAASDEMERESLEFRMFDTDAEVRQSAVSKYSRSSVFKDKVLDQYNNCCAVCKEALKAPFGYLELDAAHIVPRALKGVDDVRNGIALCKKHHWAFDHGLFGISDDGRIIVPALVGTMPENESLTRFAGEKILQTKDEAARAHPDTFRWHRQKVLIKAKSKR